MRFWPVFGLCLGRFQILRRMFFSRLWRHLKCWIRQGSWPRFQILEVEMWFELFLGRCLLRAERLPCWQISGSCFLGFARVHGPAESQPAPCSVASGTGFELSPLFTEIVHSTVLKKSSVWFLNFLIQYYSGTFILLQFAPWQIPSVRVPKSLQRNSKLRCAPCWLARIHANLRACRKILASVKNFQTPAELWNLGVSFLDRELRY